MKEFRYQVWKAFGTSLREVREERDLTQIELAQQLTRFGPGGSQSAIAKMERGERLVSIDHLAALIWILEVDVGRLLPKVVSREDQHGDAAVLLAELDELTAARDQWQRRWDTVNRRLLSLESIPDRRLVLVPEGGEADGEHHEKA